MHIKMSTDWNDADRVSDSFLQLNCVGETLEELRDVTFELPGGRADWGVKYLTRGERLYDLGNGYETVTAGTILLYEPWDVSSSKARRNDESNEMWVHVSGRYVETLWKELGFEGHKRLHIGIASDVIDKYHEIITEYLRFRPGSSQLVNAKIIELFVLIARHAGCAEDKVANEHREEVGGMWDERLAPALRQIHYCYDEELDTDGLAACCHLSRYYFCRLFRERMGSTPHQYLLNIRMRQACRLLEDTDRPLTELCQLVGFRDETAFRTAFNRAFGCSPFEYRKQKMATFLR